MSPSQGRLKVGETEMAWICTEEGERIYWTPASQEGRGRPQRRLMDVVMKDVLRVGVTEEDAGITWKKETVLCFHHR